MKKCCRCEELKPLSEFGRRSESWDGLQYDCKICKNKKANERYHSNLAKNREIGRKQAAKGTMKKFAVYYLPEMHYVGVTNNIQRRMRNHRSRGRITEGYEVMCYFERHIDAVWFEVMLHQRGYHGSQYGGMLKQQ